MSVVTVEHIQDTRTPELTESMQFAARLMHESSTVFRHAGIAARLPRELVIVAVAGANVERELLDEGGTLSFVVAEIGAERAETTLITFVWNALAEVESVAEGEETARLEIDAGGLVTGLTRTPGTPRRPRTPTAQDSTPSWETTIEMYIVVEATLHVSLPFIRSNRRVLTAR
jgi:hypothetical protein